MKVKTPGTSPSLRQFRASVSTPSVTTRRKMASLRVSLQRRRIRRITQLCTGSLVILTDPTDSTSTQQGCD